MMKGNASVAVDPGNLFDHVGTTSQTLAYIETSRRGGHLQGTVALGHHEVHARQDRGDLISLQGDA